MRRKVQDVSRRRNPFFAFNEESNPASFDNRHLLVRMIMFWSYQQRCKPKAADHQVLTDDHLTFNAFGRSLYQHVGPVEVPRKAISACTCTGFWFLINGRHLCALLFTCNSFQA